MDAVCSRANDASQRNSTPMGPVHPLRAAISPHRPSDPGSVFSNHGALAGAPLRNRTVDLLLTMQADTIWQRRVQSRYCSSEG
jgi:hypothetical protein